MHPFQRLRRAARALLAPLLVLSGGLAALPAATQEAFPNRPLTLLVPFPPGGSTDILGRALGQAMGRQLGQTIVVDNRAGAGGTVGATQVLRAPADGYTLLLGTPADQVNAPILMAKPPYDPGRDFEPVGCVVRYANVLALNPKVPVNSVAELLKLARDKPGTLHYGSAGNGNTSHLSGEMLASVAGIDIVHVPYRGNAPAITDTIGGQVQMIFSGAASVLPHIKSGALKALAVTGPARLAPLPQVPTLREAGVAVEVTSWSCLLAPARTPPEVMDRLHRALNASLDDPALQQVYENTGGEKFVTTREEAKRFLARERQIWGELIRSRNIKAD